VALAGGGLAPGECGQTGQGQDQMDELSRAHFYGGKAEDVDARFAAVQGLFIKHGWTRFFSERNFTIAENAARRSRNQFFLYCGRETKRHAALEALPAVEKRCRRRALPPQSKILAVRGVSDEWLCREFLPQGGAEGAKQTKRIL